MARTIAVVSGTRADYGILYPVLRRIQETSSLELLLIATGMHQLSLFGQTINEIKKDGFSPIELPIAPEHDDSAKGMAGTLARGVASFTEYFSKAKPDIIVVLGDRVEQLAAALAGAYLEIPIAHIHGGDNANGGFDELARGALTKLSHIHFPATKKSAARIKKMGEAAWRIRMTGSPAIDFLLGHSLRSKEELFQSYGFNPHEPLILCIQHPVTSQVSDSSRQIEITLHAIKHLGLQTLLIYPNSDAGGRAMIARIEEAKPQLPSVKTFKSIPHLDFLSFMSYCSVMVGNSSSAIIEAPSFGTPAVNLGIRQQGRERASNVLDVGHDEKQVIAALKKALSPGFVQKARRSKNPYGDGHAAERIVKVLATIPIDAKLLEKRMMDE